MNADETVKALRWIAKNDEIVFNVETANDAADLLEQLTVEIDQLKANQLVRCGECKHFDSVDSGRFCDIAEETDYCSYGERRVEE